MIKPKLDVYFTFYYKNDVRYKLIGVFKMDGEQISTYEVSCDGSVTLTEMCSIIEKFSCEHIGNSVGYNSAIIPLQQLFETEVKYTESVVMKYAGNTVNA